MTRLENPWMLLALLLVPLLAFVYVRWVRPRRAVLQYSDFRLLHDTPPSFRQRMYNAPVVLRLLVLGFLVWALARPQSGISSTTVESEGIDIILALDISGSMLAVDMTPERRGATRRDVSRLDVSKQAAREFIEGRQTDRIGLVVFSGHALTQCPPTLDYQVLLRFLDEVEVGQIEDGTAIGTALGTAVNRLRESEAKSRVVILLTDGANNAGTVDPLTAAKVAKAVGVKIYTIGAGREENARFPVETFFGRQYVRQYSPIDEETLKKIAGIGGGQYFRATSPEKLTEIYEEIGEMERTRVETKEYVEYSELAHWLVLPAVVLLLLEGLLSHVVLRRLP
ncbi:MAG: VWA domain-containing protein [Candidatus Krumholzibacteriia bacterium]